jgi:hypothetical protein
MVFKTAHRLMCCFVYPSMHFEHTGAEQVLAQIRGNRA